MKKSKKWLSILLCAAFLIGLLPTVALAAPATVSFNVSSANATGTVYYRFDTENNFTPVASGESNVNVPNGATSITVKAVPNTGENSEATINQGRSGIWIGGNKSESVTFDFNQLKGETGWTYDLAGDTPQFVVEFDNTDGTSGSDPQNPLAVSQGDIKFELGGDSEGGTLAYSIGDDTEWHNASDGLVISKKDLTSASTINLKVTLNAGYQLDDYVENGVSVNQVRTNGTAASLNFTENVASFGYSAENTYEVTVRFMSEDGSDEGGGSENFTAVIWDGKQVEVQSTHGTISVSSVEIGNKTYAYVGNGSFAAASEKPVAEELISWYGYDKTSPQEEAGVRIGDAAFANEDTKVYINFVFKPDYGYQVTGIGTNENTKSLAEAGFAAAETISTFKFEVVKHNNPHFTVVFTKTDDIIASSTAKVSGSSSSIINGSYATQSGNLKLTVEDMTTEKQAAFNEALEQQGLALQEGETATYLNLSLTQIVSKGNGTDNWETPITEFESPIALALNVGAQEGDTYRVLREHDGTITKIEAGTNGSDGVVDFQTNQFSGYVLVKKAAQTPPTPTTPTTPSTPDSSNGGSSGSSSSGTITTNPDGSTTTTVTDKATGAVTETTKNTDGSTTVVETKKDGTVTETVKAADGTTGTVVTDKSGNVTEVKASISATAVKEAGKADVAVTLPVEVPSVKTTAEAPAVQITVPKSAGSVKVEVPVETVTPGTVAVIVKADGIEEIVKATTMGKDGVVLPLADSATVKIVDNSKTFVDTASVNAWAGDAVSYVTAREIFNGTGTTTPVFSPEATMTRGMLMTVLARYEGADTTGGANWYEKGMNWAKANGVSDGSNPNGNITREQLVVMLHRYANSPVSNYAPDFPDVGNVSDYAVDAMRWAVEIGLINGMNGNLNPQGSATRAQVAAIMMRFCERKA